MEIRFILNQITGGDTLIYHTRTPDDILEKSFDDLPAMVGKGEGVPSPAVRLRNLRTVYQVLGYDLTPDLALAMIAEPKAELVVATAGGGKTTSAQIKIVMEKIMRRSVLNPEKKISGEKILYLVYNRHNVSDVREKHKKIVHKLWAANIKGLDIDDDINVSTMHSFCNFWRAEYSAKLGLVNYSLLSEDESVTMMSNVVKVLVKKYSLPSSVKIEMKDLMLLYCWAVEAQPTEEELKRNEKFVDIGLPYDLITEIFNLYEANKRIRRKYDYVDMLRKVYTLLTTDESILARVRRFYEYVVADEIQDFTPLMMDILRVLVGDGTPLLAIGDEDQNIYGFRGADYKNVLNFSERFSGAEVYTLCYNRRCRQAILDTAVSVIEKNTLRFDKMIRGIRTGGVLEYVPYLSAEGQIVKLINSLQTLSEEERENSVVCTRERKGTALLTEMLEENNIMFNVTSGYTPYTHELYDHVLQVLDILDSPMDEFSHLNLYKVLPISRNDLYDVLGYDAKTGRFKRDGNRIHFCKIDYGNHASKRGFVDAITNLTHWSEMIRKGNLNTFFGDLFTQIKKYYWILKSNINGDPLDALFEERVFKAFNVAYPYKTVYDMLAKRKDICRRNNETKSGLTVSTFHGLKGLEFKNVYIINMDNDIFPNFSLIESRGYPKEVELSLKEAERRLYYVALTRAIDRCTIYYYESNPSLFVKEGKGFSPMPAEEEKVEDTAQPTPDITVPTVEAQEEKKQPSKLDQILLRFSGGLV